jgi:peptidoglycan/LPS O-acetylase OafA/YrhL
MAKYKDYLLNKIKHWNRVAVFAAIILFIGLYNNNYELLMPIKQLKLASKYVLSDYLSAAGSCIIMMIVLAREKISRFFEMRIFTFFGDISYSFYLIHVPLILTMGSLFSNKFAFSQLYIFFSAFLLAVAGSYLMCIYIEKPFQKLAAQLITRYKIFS